MLLPGSFRLGLCLVALALSASVEAFVWAPTSSGLPSAHQQQTASPTPTTGRLCRQDRGASRRLHIFPTSNRDGAQEAARSAAVLKAAVETRKAPMVEVSEALRSLAEGGTRSPRLRAEDVEGSWELVFSTQLKSGYMPIRELVGFYPSREEASIDANAGPLPIGGMRGQCWWKGGPENELAFTLGAVKLGPFKLGKDKNEVKSYKFFVNDGKVLAAKSSSGGFALLARVNEG